MPPQAPPAHFIDFQSADGQLTANGAPFYLKGVSWRGGEGPTDLPGGLEGLHAHTLDAYMKQIADGGFNAVRLFFNHRAVLDGEEVRHFDPAVEPLLVGKAYAAALRVIAVAAAKHGLLVALVCGRLTPLDAPGNGLWASAEVPEADVLRSWSVLAHVLCGQLNVFAVDLFEEPHGATWAAGDDATDWHAAAQRIGDHVLGRCPRWLVMVQGARVASWAGTASGQEAPDLTPGENLMGVHKHRIKLSDGSKLVYAPHVAPPSEHMLPAFQSEAFPANLPALWGRNFGFVTQLTGAALVVGRVGGLLADQLDAAWQRAIVQWLVDKQAGFFYDGLNANPSLGGLLHKDWGSLRAEKVKLLEPLPVTPIASLPPPPPGQHLRVPPLPDGDAEHREPYLAGASAHDLVCLDRVTAARLRGALDWEAGGASYATMLAVYTAPHWATLLYQTSARVDDHEVQHLKRGDRLEVLFNDTACFSTAATSEHALCFQITDSSHTGHVRFENRGCGVVYAGGGGGDGEATVELDDGATLSMSVSVTRLGAVVAGRPRTAGGGASLMLTLAVAVMAVAIAIAVFRNRHELAAAVARRFLGAGRRADPFPPSAEKLPREVVLEASLETDDVETPTRTGGGGGSNGIAPPPAAAPAESTLLSIGSILGSNPLLQGSAASKPTSVVSDVPPLPPPPGSDIASSVVSDVPPSDVLSLGPIAAPDPHAEPGDANRTSGAGRKNRPRRAKKPAAAMDD